jgi:hypothetical protein
MKGYKNSRSPNHGLPTWEDTNQSRYVGQPLKSSQFDFLGHQENPFVGPGLESNPATSERQARFMRACQHNPGSMNKPCPSKKVAAEFNHT